MSAVVDFPIKPEARPYLDAFGHHSSGEPEWLGAPGTGHRPPDARGHRGGTA